MLSILSWILLIPVMGGSVYTFLCLFAVLRLRRNSDSRTAEENRYLPPVTILKPVCGLEKNLKGNLRSACLQDYPQFQVVFSVQNPDDAAIPVLKEIQEEFGPKKVDIAVGQGRILLNGKIDNLLIGYPLARNEILVISDSDIKLKPDYLKTIVSPLIDSSVGCVCTFYKAVSAEKWFEKMELLTFNADFITSVIFAHITGASRFCLGASTAIRKSMLEEIGGLSDLGDYLVEDYEMGRRILQKGKKVIVLPYFVETMVDLKTPIQWWNHQVYWDQNTRAARPAGFFATFFIRSIPFALIYALVQWNLIGLGVLCAALLIRMITAAGIMGFGLQDVEGIKSLMLLPLRDISALVSWFMAFTKKTTIWRGLEFVLNKEGRLVPLKKDR